MHRHFFVLVRESLFEGCRRIDLFGDYPWETSHVKGWEQLKRWLLLPDYNRPPELAKILIGNWKGVLSEKRERTLFG